MLVTVFILGSAFFSSLRVNMSSSSSQERPPALLQEERIKQRPFKFILGVSTGHSGSTTAHNTILRPGCPGQQVRAFEGTMAWGELNWNHTSYNQTCERVKASLIPRLYQLAQNKTLIDLGHYHNRGRAVLECLADWLEETAFVRIRRNRYDIAMSYSSKYYTPCLSSTEIHPESSICPHSIERKTAGPVYLNVDDDVWDAYSPFQRFLWYADEVEERWHILTTKSLLRTKGSQFYQVTWSTSDDLKRGLYEIRKSLGCVDEEQSEINKDTVHIPHKKRGRNCSDLIRQDLEYRRLMKYDKEQSYRLFELFPQNVASSDCMETYGELVAAIRQYSGKQEVGLDAWILPSNGSS